MPLVYLKTLGNFRHKEAPSQVRSQLSPVDEGAHLRGVPSLVGRNEHDPGGVAPHRVHDRAGPVASRDQPAWWDDCSPADDDRAVLLVRVLDLDTGADPDTVFDDHAAADRAVVCDVDVAADLAVSTDAGVAADRAVVADVGAGPDFGARADLGPVTDYDLRVPLDQLDVIAGWPGDICQQLDA